MTHLTNLDVLVISLSAVACLATATYFALRFLELSFSARLAAIEAVLIIEPTSDEPEPEDWARPARPRIVSLVKGQN